MRLQDIVLDIDKLEISEKCRSKPFVIVYSNGIAKLTYLPEHGETKVVTHQGKVKRVKFDEGEEF